ncbi:MAG: hypothetical protein CL398_02300 [Acidiferrobacteraceae bacterium]|nr:hypothetical protein [Acidiferrobacteraceae bacterium]|tara:strand:- start:930 stop:1163 length:234 start_codon:yes stop_codon:yes gene_type:complete
MAKDKLNKIERFTGLFDLPGEGFVAQIRNGVDTRLYDRQGLQHLIVKRKKTGEDFEALDNALAQINILVEVGRAVNI